MHLVFLHGVNVRRDDDRAAYDADLAERHRLVRQVLAPGKPCSIFDPYWGDIGHQGGRPLRSLPPAEAVALALGAGRLLANVAAPQRDGLLIAARQDFGAVLNSFSLVLATGSDDERAAAERIAAYAAARDTGGNVTLAAPAWLAGMHSDGDFIARLSEEIGLPRPADAALGLGDGLLKRVGASLLTSTLDAFGGTMAKAARAATPSVAQFIGDVFLYLGEGSSREEIRNRVAEALIEAARGAVAATEPLVVVGHSMGGIVLADMLADASQVTNMETSIGAPLKVDLLLTVGSQVGLFAELGVLEPSGAPLDRRPASVARWWHVFNRMDVLSFGLASVVAGVEEFSLDTGAAITDAHGAYLRSPVLYARLHKRMEAAGLFG